MKTIEKCKMLSIQRKQSNENDFMLKRKSVKSLKNLSQHDEFSWKTTCEWNKQNTVQKFA